MDGSAGAGAWVALFVAVGVLAGAGIGGAGATAVGDASGSGSGSGDGFGSQSESVDAGGTRVPSTQIEADQVVIGVRLHPNGTATWSVAYRIRLRTENDTAAFEELQRNIAANRSRYVSGFAAGIEPTVADAQNRTDRKMNASGFSVRTDRRQLPREYGIVTYQFRWDGFAAVDGERIAVSETLSGFFLDASTRLSVTWPADYRSVAVAPGPDERRESGVVWVGPLDFPAGTPRVVAAPNTTGGGGDGNGGGEGDAAPGAGGLPVLIPVVAATLVAAAAVVAYRRFEGLGDRAEASSESGVAAPAGPTPAAAGGGASGDDATDATDATDGDVSTEEDPPAELLSNEEQVLRFLSSSGGRAKQQDLVAALDWTEARTSQVVSGMEEDGAVEKFRIGRENVLKLPDEEDGGEGESDQT
jgi:hypothetical protein